MWCVGVIVKVWCVDVLVWCVVVLVWWCVGVVLRGLMVLSNLK